MGLDMHATRRTHVGNCSRLPAEKRYAIQVTRGGKPAEGVRPERITMIEEELIRWRKANHIHAWFVDNVQNGNDDCNTYYVSTEHLRTLLDACSQVIKASELVE